MNEEVSQSPQPSAAPPPSNEPLPAADSRPPADALNSAPATDSAPTNSPPVELAKTLTSARREQDPKYWTGSAERAKPLPVVDAPLQAVAPPLTPPADPAESLEAPVLNKPSKTARAEPNNLTSSSPSQNDAVRYKRRKLLSGLFIAVSVFSILLASIAGWLVWFFWVK